MRQSYNAAPYGKACESLARRIAVKLRITREHARELVAKAGSLKEAQRIYLAVKDGN